jgi:hypothetical protein
MGALVSKFDIHGLAWLAIALWNTFFVNAQYSDIASAVQVVGEAADRMLLHTGLVGLLETTGNSFKRYILPACVCSFFRSAAAV